MATQPPGAFDVNVKDFRGGSVVVSVLPAWNVGQVKQEIARKMNVAAPEFKLVFAGQTLSDGITLAVSTGWLVGRGGECVGEKNTQCGVGVVPRAV